MSLYKIKPYSFEQASKLGVTIKPSHLANKKIDVFNHKGSYFSLPKVKIIVI